MAHGSPDKSTDIKNILDRAIGGSGGVIVSGTGVNNGNYIAIQCVTDVTLTTLTGNLTGTATGITYPAGLVIHGLFTVVTLATGTAILYNR